MIGKIVKFDDFYKLIEIFYWRNLGDLRINVKYFNYFILDVYIYIFVFDIDFISMIVWYIIKSYEKDYK